VPTKTPGRAQPSQYYRPRWRRVMTVLVVLAVLAGGAVYAGITIYRHVVVSLISPGCMAGLGANSTQVDPGQAPVAATIAGVAARMDLPRRALEIAYATALQESKMTNVPGGDRDSVGVFQQRPSQGWGTAAQLQDPEFASTAFFKALVKVPHYTTIPIYQAAQDVQHSADGSAYQQWENDAALLAASYTATPHGVTCWYKPTSAGHPQLASVTARIPVVFGSARSGAPVEGISRAGTALRVRVSSSQGWTVAHWLMTRASMYGLTKVGYGGWQWSASLTESAWQAAPGIDAGSIVAS
jgi:hypothetical protein